MANSQPDFTFVLINVTFWTIFAMFVLSLRRVAKMVKYKKWVPKALQRENAKITNSTSQKWFKTLRSSVKKWNLVGNLTIWMHFLVINVTFWAIFEKFRWCFLQSPCVSQSLWGWFCALYHFRYPPNDKMNMSKMLQNVTFMCKREFPFPKPQPESTFQ